MPVMDGYKATRCIRQMPNLQNLPIIAMTAAALQHDKALCLEAGMNDHISKPINPDLMIDKLIQWIVTPEFVPVENPNFEIANVDASQDLQQILKGFDLVNVLTMLAGDESALIRLLRGFKEKFLSEDSTIETLLFENKIEEAQKRLHTLKGSSGNLGITPLYQASMDLDEQLRTGQYDPETLSHWKNTFYETMECIENLPNS